MTLSLAELIPGAKSMKDLATKVLLGLLALGAIGLVLYGAVVVGKHLGRAEVVAEQAKQQLGDLAKAHKDYVAEVERGRESAQRLQAELADQRSINDDLAERLKDVPRLTSTSKAACPDPSAVHLTGAGLLRWNTALGYPDLSAAACGADGAAAGLCAAGSGISIERAQLNAETNFRIGKEIRTRCQALMDHLAKRPVAASAPSPTN